MKIKYVLLFLLFLILIITAIDLVRISGYETFPVQPDDYTVLEDEVYFDLVNGETEIDWNRLNGTLDFCDSQYDCADFRLVNLIRILYDYGHLIPDDYMKKIEQTLFDFRYWWDEPGGNSMAYWTENHQILFTSAEYLIGQKYPEAIFQNSGLTGREHMEKARIRALDWLSMRWNFGFSEFYSNYYKENIAALINLIDYAEDEELVKKSKIVLDLLFYDVASQSQESLYSSVSGRAYTDYRLGRSTLNGLTTYLWGDGKELEPDIFYAMMVTEKYQLPPVITEIAKDRSTVVIKQSNGLDISELKTEGYYGTDTRSIMMQWGIHAFTNAETIRNSMEKIRRNNLFTNKFLSDFKYLDFTLINWLRLEPLLSRIINPQYNGVAIQRGNTYTYKNRDFSMYTVQNHHPGNFANQLHVFGVNIKNHFAVFHTHPAVEMKVKRKSPNYWVGYGRLPHSVQNKNVNLSIYRIPGKKGFLELDLLDYTRAYFPVAKFDTAFVANNYVFGKKGETYIAFIGANPLEYRNDSNYDIIQEGRRVFWIAEASSKIEDGSFDAFTNRIMHNEITFDDSMLELVYHSNGKEYKLTYGADFRIDGNVVNTAYKRFDSPYVQAEQKDKSITFTHNGTSLYLDFENVIREF
ncbi:MAG: hypothetical protein R6U28_08130 [Cyclonatronaceae bacterium]